MLKFLIYYGCSWILGKLIGSISVRQHRQCKPEAYRASTFSACRLYRLDNSVSCLYFYSISTFSSIWVQAISQRVCDKSAWFKSYNILCYNVILEDPTYKVKRQISVTNSFHIKCPLYKFIVCNTCTYLMLLGMLVILCIWL